MATRQVTTVIQVCDFCKEDIEYDYVRIENGESDVWYLETNGEGMVNSTTLHYDSVYHPRCFINHLIKELEINY
jgi:hypothetical protein